jgi:predicted transcriptional regulator YdeE
MYTWRFHIVGNIIEKLTLIRKLSNTNLKIFTNEITKAQNNSFNKNLEMYLNRNVWFKINSTYIYVSIKTKAGCLAVSLIN